MIGDTYKIKYSDYLMNGRYLLIDATDHTNRPGIIPTNFNSAQPTPYQNLDMTFYGYRASGYGGMLWNNLFNLLENYAQPSATTSTVPLYSQYPTIGQIWVDSSHTPPIARWYGRDNTFYKLGAAVNVAADSSQVSPGELWFNSSAYTFNFYSTSWGDISCIPYVSQLEYSRLVVDLHRLIVAAGLQTIPEPPTLSTYIRPTPADWVALLATVQALGVVYSVSVPSGEPADTVIASNFTDCNANVYGIATIRLVYSQIRIAVRKLTDILFPPSGVPLAEFTATPSIGVAPLLVTFTDETVAVGGYKTVHWAPISDSLVYAWDFGDGSTSTTVGSTSHLYPTQGTYVVTLTVANSAGSTTAQSPVHAYTIPAASFTVDHDIGEPAPYIAHFTDTSTNSPTSWLWDFGDGNTSSEQNPAHSYANQGFYVVTLVVANTAGSSSANLQHHIIVQVGRTPLVDFTYTPVTPITADPATIQFTDTSTHTPTNWAWDFGDGTTSTDTNPIHVYQNQGFYNVSLTVTNPIGHTSTQRMGYIRIGGIPTASFTAAVPPPGAQPTSVVFTDTSQSHPTSWLWNFGDNGATSTTQNPTHPFQWGVYTVSLTASNVLGTSAPMTHQIDVAPPVPVAGFNFTPTSGQAPVTIQFTDTSMNSPTSWLWKFGDGSGVTSTQQNPTHVYATTGQFMVTLTATNRTGSHTIYHTTGYISPVPGTTTSTSTSTSGHSYNQPGDGSSAATSETGGYLGSDGLLHVTGDETSAVYNGNLQIGLTDQVAAIIAALAYEGLDQTLQSLDPATGDLTAVTVVGPDTTVTITAPDGVVATATIDATTGVIASSTVAETVNTTTSEYHNLMTGAVTTTVTATNAVTGAVITTVSDSTAGGTSITTTANSPTAGLTTSVVNTNLAGVQVSAVSTDNAGVTTRVTNDPSTGGLVSSVTTNSLGQTTGSVTVTGATTAVSATNPTTGVTTTTATDSSTGVTSTATTNPTTGVTSVTTTNPTTGETTSATTNSTTGQTTSTTTTSTTTTTTTTNSDGSSTSQTTNNTTGAVTASSTTDSSGTTTNTTPGGTPTGPGQ